MNFFNYRDFIINESVNLTKRYVMDLNWWTLWKNENESKYNITLNGIDKTYEIKDNQSKEIIFIYDYDRQKVFTNKKPSFFDIKDSEISPKELNKEIDKEKEKIEPSKEKDEKKKEGESDPLNKTEEE